MNTVFHEHFSMNTIFDEHFLINTVYNQECFGEHGFDFEISMNRIFDEEKTEVNKRNEESSSLRSFVKREMSRSVL